MRWDRLSESRIRRAEARGELRGLSGEGKPLPDRPETAILDTGTAVGHRIMAESGALPREVELKKRMDALRTALAAENDPAARKQIMAELAEVQMRHAMEAEARRAFLR